MKASVSGLVVSLVFLSVSMADAEACGMKVSSDEDMSELMAAFEKLEDGRDVGLVKLVGDGPIKGTLGAPVEPKELLPSDVGGKAPLSKPVTVGPEPDRAAAPPKS